MGMLQSLMKKSAEHQSGADFLAEVNGRLPDFADGAEGASAWILTGAQFEQAWREQENLKQTAEVKERYRAFTAQGRVVFVEIEW